MEEVAKYLRALIVLQVADMSDDDAPKPEILLARAGLGHKDIAEILGKKPAAIAKAISRAK